MNGNMSRKTKGTYINQTIQNLNKYCEPVVYVALCKGYDNYGKASFFRGNIFSRMNFSCISWRICFRG